MVLPTRARHTVMPRCAVGAKKAEELMAVKGVFFDLYGTLLDYQDMQAAWATWETTFYQSLYPYGLTVSPGVFATYCDRFFGKPAPAAPAEGCTVFEGRIQAVCHTLRLDVPTAAIKAIATTLVTAWQQYIPIDPECLQVLQTLHSRYTLGLISNFDHPPHVHQVLDDHGLRQWFAVIVISGEVGVQKPHPQIFRVALEQTGLTPADVVYVGDTVDDVQGARAAGMHPILIRRAHQRLPAVDFQVHSADTDTAAPGRVPEAVETIARLSELLVRLERQQRP
jgi:putative hydrolase of the HAD superfamily